jgi:hypothetical protein
MVVRILRSKSIGVGKKKRKIRLIIKKVDEFKKWVIQKT